MIEIKTTGETPLEALASLVAFGQRCMSNETVRIAADRILNEEQKKVETAASANSQTFGNLAPAVCQTIGNLPPAVPVNPAPAPAPTPGPASAAAAAAVPVTGQTAAPVNPTPPAAPVPVNAAPPVVPTAPAPGFTLEQVGKAGADLIAANPAKMPELLGLLGQFGVQAITELKPEQVGAFATALRGLGAKL